MRVYLGIPFYGGACAEFVSALLSTRLVLDRAGYEVEVDMHTGCSILPKARNEITRRFAASGFDVLVFLDTDLSWNPADLVRLVNSPHLVSACAYRNKQDTVRFMAELTGRERDGWKEATHVGTGFLAIKREAVLEMQQAYPQYRYLNDAGEVTFALFDFELHEGRYWGEDYTFCRRWTALGNDISVWADATLSHHGPKAYTGNLSEAP